METGRLKKSKITWSGKDVTVPKEFGYDRDQYKNVECKFEHINSIATRIIVIIDGNETELSKDQRVIEKKIENIEKREQEAIAQKEREKQEREKQRAQPAAQNNQNQGNAMPSDSFLQSAAKVPSDVPNLSDTTTSNFALKLYKFARFDEQDKNKAKFFSKNRNEYYCIKHNDYGLGQKINEIAVKHKESAKILFNTEGCLESENFKPDWRVVVGLGTDSVYETGITLHHIYGFPYIPASAIKGITNHYAQDMLKDENQVENEKLGNNKVTDDNYKTIFGSTKHQGIITFFDAMPVSIPQLKPDIMNVHYPKYYDGSQAPTDTQSPIPILFLTVEKTAFQFMVGCKEVDKDLLPIVFEWLKQALQNKGIGAKTAVGYGYMK